MTTISHICMSIRGFLKSAEFPREYRDVVKDDAGDFVSPEAAREYFLDCLEKGWKVLPLEKCEGFSYETGCPGHACKEEEA